MFFFYFIHILIVHCKNASAKLRKAGYHSSSVMFAEIFSTGFEIHDIQNHDIESDALFCINEAF